MSTAPLPRCTTPSGWARSYANTPSKAARYALWARQQAQQARQGPITDLASAQHWEQVADALDAVLAGQTRCRRCGRALTHPDSVASGIGPECAGREAPVEIRPGNPQGYATTNPPPVTPIVVT